MVNHHKNWKIQLISAVLAVFNLFIITGFLVGCGSEEQKPTIPAQEQKNDDSDTKSPESKENDDDKDDDKDEDDKEENKN